MATRTLVGFLALSCVPLTGILLCPGCREETPDAHLPLIVVTNSYLQSAAMDIAGESFRVVSLCPPGMCPGHFDLSPGNAKDLRTCDLVIRFDFQSQLDKSLAGLRDSGLPVESIASREGMCIPQTYADTCEAIAERLAAMYHADAEGFRQRLDAVRRRMNELDAEMKQMNLRGKVLASNHQAAFCTWLGYDVASTFVGSDMATVANVQASLAKAREGVTLVVANRQEGTTLAKGLADAAAAPLAVFSNFPDISLPSGNFEAMVRANVRQVCTDGTE